MERRGMTALRWFLLPGFCGGMTTFSAVTIEVVGEDALGFSYLAMTVVASLVTIAVVIPFARATIKEKQ
jgi:CrcB protein